MGIKKNLIKNPEYGVIAEIKIDWCLMLVPVCLLLPSHHGDAQNTKEINFSYNSRPRNLLNINTWRGTTRKKPPNNCRSSEHVINETLQWEPDINIKRWKGFPRSVFPAGLNIILRILKIYCDIRMQKRRRWVSSAAGWTFYRVQYVVGWLLDRLRLVIYRSLESFWRNVKIMETGRAHLFLLFRRSMT